MQEATGPKHDYDANAKKADRYHEAVKLLTAKHDLGTLQGSRQTVRIYHILFEEYGGERTMWAFTGAQDGWYWDGETFFRLCERPSLLEEELSVVAYVTKDDPELPEFLDAILAQ